MSDPWGELILSSEDYKQTKTLAQEARERGIDPTKQGWMARVLTARQKEKEKEGVTV